MPPLARAEWRARWDAKLWNWWILVERGELTTRDHAEMIRHCWGSFADAFWLRFQREHLRHSLRGPVFCLASAAGILSLLAGLSGGLPATRALFNPLPLADPGSLISIRYSGAANEPYGVPPRFVTLWRAKSALLADVAGYRHPKWAPRAWVTPNFFSLLGTPAAAGRTFQPGDTDAAVISGRIFRSLYAADPRAVGAVITLDGRAYTIIGVLPEAFWALHPGIDVWTPLRLEPEPAADVPFLIGVVGRVKPGVSEPKLRTELFELAKTIHPFLPRPPQVASFTALPDRPLFAYLTGVAFALLIGIVLVALGRSLPARTGWRYRSFLAIKTFFLIVLPALLWVEIASAVSALLPETGVRSFAGLVFTVVFLITGACAIWWSFADQRRRCPVCLHLLTMPVSIGSPASVFEPATTELLCEAGHGSLCVPESETGEPDRWTALDPSWRELFSGK